MNSAENNLKIPVMKPVKEASKLVAGAVTVYRIRQWVKQGKVKFTLAGTKVLVNIDSLIEHLNNGDNMKCEEKHQNTAIRRIDE